MSDPLIHQMEHYVVIEPGKKEQILSEEETLTWLIKWVKDMQSPSTDLDRYISPRDKAQHLIDTACELHISPGMKIQWFAVRIEPPKYIK